LLIAQVLPRVVRLLLLEGIANARARLKRNRAGRKARVASLTTNSILLLPSTVKLFETRRDEVRGFSGPVAGGGRSFESSGRSSSWCMSTYRDAVLRMGRASCGACGNSTGPSQRKVLLVTGYADEHRHARLIRRPRHQASTTKRTGPASGSSLMADALFEHHLGADETAGPEQRAARLHKHIVEHRPQ